MPSSTYSNLRVWAAKSGTSVTWEKRDRIFHPKLYISQSAKGNRLTFLTGSYNLTKRALEKNREHGLWVECQGKEQVGQDTVERFNEFWGAAECLTQEVVDNYKEVWEKNRPDIDEDELCSLGDPAANEFSWPSEEAAFLMGAICARGRFKPTEGGGPCIEISLQFHKESTRNQEGTKGFRHSNRGSHEAPDKIAAIARQVLPGARDINTKKQKVTIGFHHGDQAFRDIFDAFGQDTTSKSLGFPLPTGLRRLGPRHKTMIRNFVQGYAVSSSLITPRTKMPKYIDPNGPYIVHICPIKAHQPMFLVMEKLINKLGVCAKAISLKPDSEFHAVAVKAEEFGEQIQFGIRRWDELVERAANLNLSGKSAYFGSNRPTVTVGKGRRSGRRGPTAKSRGRN